MLLDSLNILFIRSEILDEELLKVGGVESPAKASQPFHGHYLDTTQPGEACERWAEDDAAKARFAVIQWSTITLHPILELMQAEGRLAYHSNGEDGIGLPGWHSIVGDLFGWCGPGVSAEPMQRWFGEADVLPALSAVAEPSFAGRQLSWVRFFLGGNGQEDVAEIKVNGLYSAAATEVFASMDWPRPPGPAYLKSFVLVLPPST